MTSTTPPTFTTLHSTLSSLPPPLLPPPSTLIPSLTPRIASALLHPTLEALLHLLNHDLPPAHFLVRHMQAPPALEGMYIHGILHRIEGDLPNCLAWYTDVASSPAFTNFYGDGDGKPKIEQHLAFLSAGERRDFAAPGPGDVEQKLPPQAAARVFVRAIEELRGRSTGAPGYAERKAALERVSRAELEAVVEWCVAKFGTDRVEDASAAWTRPGEETRKMGEDMVSGGKGYRKF